LNATAYAGFMAEALLYLIGGPQRTGKTIATTRFGQATGVSVVSTDDFTEMLQRAAPQLGIGHEIALTWRDNRALVAPFVEAFARVHVREDRPVLIEGELLPESVAALLNDFGVAVHACFLGNADVPIEVTERAIIAYSQAHNDWLAGSTPEQFRDVALEVRTASREYRTAASELGIPYFEMQPNFEAAVERVLRHLRGLS
jgi:hypothetical protein